MSFDEDNNPFSSGINEQFTDLPISQTLHSESTSFINQDEVNDVRNQIGDLHLNGESHVAEAGESNEAPNFEDTLPDTRITQILSDANLAISIMEAGKSIEGTSKSYIVYTIKLGDIITRRRYSEFESLRNVLTKVFPLLIIPPIPSKTLSLISNNEDKLIEHRKRTLNNFLNNCIKIRKIRNLAIFQKFLDPNSNWNDDLSVILSRLPKSTLKSNPINGLDTPAIYSYLPSPSTSSTTISYLIDDSFSKMEENSKEFEFLITNGLDKVNKKLIKHFVDLAAEYTELGSVFNSFSLLETNDNDISIMADKVGQVFDGSYLSLNTVITELDRNFMEPLGESVQFNNITRDVLKFRNKKIHQESSIKTNLKTKIDEINELNKSDKESKRIESALSSQVLNPKSAISFDRPGKPVSPSDNGVKSSSTSPSTPPKDAEANYDTNIEPITEPKPSKKFKIPGLNKITTVIQGVIDQNPELTRKQRIISLHKQIGLLKQCDVLVMKDMTLINDIINSEFEKFQKKQILSFKQLLYDYNSFLLDWGKKNLELWEEVKVEILKL